MSQPKDASECELSAREEATATDDSGFRRAQKTLSDTDRSSLSSLPPSKKDLATLTVLNGPARGVIIQLDRPSLVIGRSADDADVVIPEPSLSRAHARIRRVKWPAGTQYIIEDLGSTNGTFVGRSRIERPTLLDDGVRVGLGRRTFLRFGVQDMLEQEALLQVHRSALHDALTGVSNRGVFEQRMHSEMAYARRHRSRVTLIMVDVDHFKRFNDSYGHQAGDAALRHVASVMQRELRPEDLLARYGGEEFAIVLRDASTSEAQWVAERIRSRLEKNAVYWGTMELPISASFGLAHYDGTGALTSAELVSVADGALYRAKARGRNCWVDAGIVSSE